MQEQARFAYENKLRRWGELPQLSVTPKVWNCCFRAVSSPVCHALTERRWGPVLLVTCCCFLLCSGVICPVLRDADSQLVPGPHQWWKVIFLKGCVCQHGAASLLACHRRFGSSGSSKCIQATAELPAVLDAVWCGVWLNRSYILSAWRSQILVH